MGAPPEIVSKNSAEPSVGISVGGRLEPQTDP